jgi:uncharacterized membrane protein YdbT with pleckstrin-like domain
MATGYIKSMLGEREHILYLTRQHWFVFVSSILVEITVVIGLAIITLGATLLLPPITPWLMVLIPMILLLIPILGGTRDFLIWWNRQYIVTNRRVIQISGIFNKNVTDSSLEKVNDVKMDQSAFGRMFNFGDVEILTASELGVNKFNRIGDPIRFKTAMLNAKVQLESGEDLPSRVRAEEVEEDIPTMIERLDQLRKQGVITEEEFQTKKTDLLSKL